MQKKLIKYNICCLLILTLLTSNFSVYAKADDIILSDDIVVYYDKEQQEILDKINYLGQLKAKAAAIKEYFNLSENTEIELNLYESVLSDIETVRSELIELGAKPSAETLETFKFSEPISIQGVLIDDFESFENTFDGAFDLWGVSQTVTASYGTYNTYDIIIQDYPNNTILTTSISQNGSAGYDLYASNPSLVDVMVGRLDDILFETIKKSFVNNIPVISTLYRGARMLRSVQSVTDEITPNAPVSVNGLSQMYKILCTATSSVHYIYVRPSGGTWQHTYSTNTVYLNEQHIWAMSFATGNGRTETYPGTEDYSTTLTPSEWSLRLTNAITAYRNNKSLYHDVINEYSFNVVNGNTSEEAFCLDIICPITYNDLIRYGVQ